MTHIEDGRLLAWMDGELDEVEARRVEARLREDAGTARRLEQVRARSATVGQALARADAPVPLERARTRLEATLRAARPPAGRAATSGAWWTRRTRLAQAAALVLLLAGGAAAAVPGSPVRAWIERTLTAPSPVATAADPVEQAETSDDVGVWIDPADGAVRIGISGAPDGTEVRVSLVDRERAGVSAPPGTALRSGRGWIEAAVDSGPVTVELPRTLGRATLSVDGRTYLTMEDGAVELRAPASIAPRDRYRFITGR